MQLRHRWRQTHPRKVRMQAVIVPCHYRCSTRALSKTVVIACSLSHEPNPMTIVTLWKYTTRPPRFSPGKHIVRQGPPEPVGCGVASLIRRASGSSETVLGTTSSHCVTFRVQFVRSVVLPILCSVILLLRSRSACGTVALFRHLRGVSFIFCTVR